MYCIQETDKPNVLLKTLDIIKLTENRILLPITGDEILSHNKADKLVRKTRKVLDNTISKRVVISKKLKKQKEFMELLKKENLEIIEGEWLFEVLSCKILDYIIQHKKIKKQETSISILVNDLSENMVEIIRQIAKEYKRVNIVTNYIEKFKKIEKQIFQEDGIMITVGNNKKKGLANSEIILNVDFPSNVINQYNIYETAIIINLKTKVIITKKRFNGITINNYDITFKNFDDYDYDKHMKYKACEMYEAQINKKQPYYEIMKKIKEDKVEIAKLMGKNAIY